MKRLFLASLLAPTIFAGPALAIENSQNSNLNTNAETGLQTHMNDRFQSGVTLNSADTMELQQALNNQGFFNGRVDGIWGPSTSNALRRFQKENNLSGNGKINDETLNQLGVTLSMNHD